MPSTRSSAVAQSARKLGAMISCGRAGLRAHLGAALEVALHRIVRRGALEQLAHQPRLVEGRGQKDRGRGRAADTAPRIAREPAPAGRLASAPVFLNHPAPMAAALGLLLFLAALFAAAKLLPGRDVAGREEPDGTRFRYRINGMAVFVATNLRSRPARWSSISRSHR